MLAMASCEISSGQFTNFLASVVRKYMTAGARSNRRLFAV